MVNINEENIRKRLLAVNQTQEAVQTCSKWILHHRDSIDRIASCWMNVYKKASDKLRIALIYVLNDIVQKAANKLDTNVTLAFHPHWINATGISNVTVKKAISRCVEVLEQRNVYPPHIIEEMKAALVSRIATEKDESQNGEIDFFHLTRGIDSFYKHEVLIEKAREILARGAFNFKESVQARVKDRAEGVKALADMDVSRQKMVAFLESVEKHQQKGLKHMELMKQAKQSFNLQLRDVTVVNDAYDKFAEGIRETRQQLEIMEKSGALMAVDSSPPRDAPSPTAGDDPFVHGVDGEEQDGAEDMEMDEEDAPGPSSCFLKPSKDYVASIPVVPDMDPRLHRMINPNMINQQTNNGASAANQSIIDPRQLDPRQARFFPPPQQPPPQVQQQINFPPPLIPPPGISPPPVQNPVQNAAESMISIDTSHPPPHLFSMPPPQIANGNIHPGTASTSTSLSPPVAMFNPNNPPPSLLAPQMQVNFSMPPPNFMQHTSLNQLHPSPMPHYGQKRSADGFGSAACIKRRRQSWSSTRRDQDHRWSNDNSGDRTWRRSHTGDDGGRYRH